MIMHPLRGGEKGATSRKQFTSNMLMGYWLFVKLPGVYLCGVVLVSVHLCCLSQALCGTEHDPAVQIHDSVIDPKLFHIKPTWSFITFFGLLMFLFMKSFACVAKFVDFLFIVFVIFLHFVKTNRNFVEFCDSSGTKLTVLYQNVFFWFSIFNIMFKAWLSFADKTKTD